MPRDRGLAPILWTLLFFALLQADARAAPWRIDPETTLSVDVAWRDSTVKVRFPELTGQIEFDASHPDDARAVIVAAAGRATTGLAPADRLLRGEGYLDVAHFPTVEFRLDRLVQTSKQTADVFGSLTLRGVARPVAFKAQVLRYGPAAGDASRFEAGFDISGTIDRTEFGSTAGIPDVAAVLPIHIRLLMSSTIAN